MRIQLLMTLLAATGCSGDPGTGGDGGSDAEVGDLAAPADLAAGDGPIQTRPYQAKVPTGYDAAKPTPLVVLLHGYTGNGAQQAAYFRLAPLADARTFLLAYPDGTIDQWGNRFWNGTDTCCDLFDTGVDDVAYIGAVIDDMQRRYNVDRKRVYLVGHSNGGFMAHRLACDLAPRIAGIVSLAGATFKDPAACKPSEPVAILQVHGDADMTIRYGGGQLAPNAPLYPGARETADLWAAKNGCAPGAQASPRVLDLDSGIAGTETRIDVFGGCRANGAVELWTIQGGGHIPAFQPTWAETFYGFLDAHPKP